MGAAAGNVLVLHLGVGVLFGLGSGLTYLWTVKTKDQLGLIGEYAPERLVAASTPPTITVQAPAGAVIYTVVRVG